VMHAFNLADGLVKTDAFFLLLIWILELIYNDYSEIYYPYALQSRRC
jgi:hypothetical protein